MADEPNDSEEQSEEWSPEKEKEEDPIKFAREMMKDLKGMMGGLGGEMGPFPHRPRRYVPPPFIRGVAGYHSEVRIRRISNGFVMGYPTLSGSGQVEHFFTAKEFPIEQFKEALGELDKLEKASKETDLGIGLGDMDPLSEA